MPSDPVVEYCIDNVDGGTRRRLASTGAVEKPCLQRCGRCRRSALLVVDGDPVVADSHADLLAEVDP